MSALVVARYGRDAAYGAEELKLAAHRYAFLALSISILIHFCMIGFYYVNAAFDSNIPQVKPPFRGVLIDIPDFPLPIPGIIELPPPSGRVVPKTGDAGTIVPVPEDPSTLEKTYKSQGELAGDVDPHGIIRSSEETTTSRDLVIPDTAPPDTFIAVEKDPVIVKSVVPEYPPLALKAGLEGRVFVKMWVDRQGKVREVRVIKTNNDIFNDASVEAAKQFVFTPAYMNNGPVSVWVAMPFRFRLTGTK